jgi:outer membrane lipoprotein-sorting protein
MRKYRCGRWLSFRISILGFRIWGRRLAGIWNAALMILVVLSSVVLASPFDGLKKTYSEINTLETSFHQKIYIAGLKKERDFDGEFLYKRGRGFLWKYKTPKAKYFLYDGRNIYQGEEEKPFIIKERINKE